MIFLYIKPFLITVLIFMILFAVLGVIFDGYDKAEIFFERIATVCLVIFLLGTVFLVVATLLQKVWSPYL